jgi:mRNA-degrading endonuclease toxin of MazEF toxin-antitoxin module
MPQVQRGDVLTANLEPIQGSEQGGSRPVVGWLMDWIKNRRPHDTRSST